jgi:hypothetical protein
LCFLAVVGDSNVSRLGSQIPGVVFIGRGGWRVETGNALPVGDVENVVIVTTLNDLGKYKQKQAREPSDVVRLVFIKKKEDTYFSYYKEKFSLFQLVRL